MSLSRHFSNICLVTLCFAFCGSSQAAGKDYDKINKAGDVTGKISVCGVPAAGVLVFAPGTSFSAITDGGGAFKLSYVQQGTYDLVIKSGITPIGIVSQVIVKKKQVLDIGYHEFCGDTDGDGYAPPQDCDDSNPAINPGVAEACGDGVDNNCNGASDEGCTNCTDFDLDGFFAQSGCGSEVDCNDSNASINPQAEEICDGLDNDCDSETDESGSDAISYYFDGDGDGYGLGSNSVVACAPPVGYVLQPDDCDDANASINPGQDEICDGIDNNCNDLTDDGGFLCDSQPNGSGICLGSAGCAVVCDTGFSDCNGISLDGCEVDILTDVENCGECNNACPIGVPDSTVSCIQGSCLST